MNKGFETCSKCGLYFSNFQISISREEFEKIFYRVFQNVIGKDRHENFLNNKNENADISVLFMMDSIVFLISIDKMVNNTTT